MAMLAVNIPDDLYSALRTQAVLHGRSADAEVCEILANAIKPEKPIRMGDALAALGRQMGLTGKDVEAINQVQNKTPAQPIGFE